MSTMGKSSSVGSSKKSKRSKTEKDHTRKIDDDVSTSSKRTKRRAVSSSSRSDDDSDVSFGWSCTVCTYRNPSQAFRCEICDVRKGTSTRKPRLNSQLVQQQQTVQKFVQQQQQAMMAQANRDKREKATNEKLNFASSPPRTPSSTFSTTSWTGAGTGTGNYCSLSESPSCSKTPPPVLTAVHCGDHVTSSSTWPCNYNSHTVAYSSSPSPSPSPSSSISKKFIPTIHADHSNKKASKCDGSNSAVSSPLAGISKLSTCVSSKSLTVNEAEISNVDENSARTLAVTVNGITVVITDYKLRSSNEIGSDGDDAGCSYSDAAPELKLAVQDTKKRRNWKKKKLDSTTNGEKGDDEMDEMKLRSSECVTMQMESAHNSTSSRKMESVHNSTSSSSRNMESAHNSTSSSRKIESVHNSTSSSRKMESAHNSTSSRKIESAHNSTSSSRMDEKRDGLERSERNWKISCNSNGPECDERNWQISNGKKKCNKSKNKLAEEQTNGEDA